MISVEVLLLAVSGGITLLAYMIAINAHGPVRLSLSYLLATCLLAGSVYVTVQYVNTKVERKQMEEMHRLEYEKTKAEEQVKTQQQALTENKELMAVAGKLNAIITRGAGLASSMAGLELQDRSVDLNALISRAVDAGAKCRSLKDAVDSLQAGDGSFGEVIALLKDAAQLINESAYYYKLYYYSEDSAQEDVRAKVMRQKARAAYEKLQKASDLVSAGASQP